jgi:hypothetical protein
LPHRPIEPAGSNTGTVDNTSGYYNKGDGDAANVDDDDGDDHEDGNDDDDKDEVEKSSYRYDEMETCHYLKMNHNQERPLFRTESDSERGTQS